MKKRYLHSFFGAVEMMYFFVIDFWFNPNPTGYEGEGGQSDQTNFCYAYIVKLNSLQIYKSGLFPYSIIGMGTKIGNFRILYTAACKESLTQKHPRRSRVKLILHS